MIKRLGERTLGQFGIECLDPGRHHFRTDHVTSCDNVANVRERRAESNRVAAADDGKFGPRHLQQVGQSVGTQHIRLRYCTFASIQVYVTEIEGTRTRADKGYNVDNIVSLVA